MEYFEFPAPAPLADVVRCVWLLAGSAAGTAEPQPIVPDGCAEIVFNLADRFHRFAANGEEAQPRSMVVGQITEAVVIAPSGGVDIVGVRLQPWGATSVLPIASAELRDTLLPLDAVAASLSRDLPDLLYERRSPAERAVTVFRYLARHVRPSGGQRRARARAIVHEATRGSDTMTVRALARRLGLAERQVERELDRHVGLRPKMLLRIARFQRALAIARSDETLSWSAVAARAGLFDQAHLTHEFKRFAACTPAAYLGRDRSITDLFLDDGV